MPLWFVLVAFFLAKNKRFICIRILILAQAKQVRFGTMHSQLIRRFDVTHIWTLFIANRGKSNTTKYWAYQPFLGRNKTKYILFNIDSLYKHKRLKLHRSATFPFRTQLKQHLQISAAAAVKIPLEDTQAHYACHLQLVFKVMQDQSMIAYSDETAKTHSKGRSQLHSKIKIWRALHGSSNALVARTKMFPDVRFPGPANSTPGASRHTALYT